VSSNGSARTETALNFALLQHIDRLFENISKKKGLSIINWVSSFGVKLKSETDLPSLSKPNPSLFSSPEAAETIKSAQATLSGVSTTFPDARAPGKPAAGEIAAKDLGAGKGLDLQTNRIFDLDVAKASGSPLGITKR